MTPERLKELARVFDEGWQLPEVADALRRLAALEQVLPTPDELRELGVALEYHLPRGHAERRSIRSALFALAEKLEADE